MEREKKVTAFERSVDTILLSDFLSKSEKEFISYEELSKEIGKDVRKEAMGNLYSARRIQEREYDKVWLTVRGEGIKLAKDSDCFSIIGASLKKIRKETKRSIFRANKLNTDHLGREEKKKIFMGMSILGTLAVMTRNNSTKKLADHCERKMHQLDFKETLEAFVGKS